MEEVEVVVVGAGPAGLSTSACLNRLSIPNILLEKEDCYASLWKKRAYDRLKLHLAKEYCALPYMPFPPELPTFVPRAGFCNYLDNYVSTFGINPRCNRTVESASYNEKNEKWVIRVKNTALDEYETYMAKFLVVATGENSEGIIPEIPGLDSFKGTYFHSNKYQNGKRFTGQKVLVVGCGNSGMEIAYDLQQWGAKTSLVARSPVHILTKGLVYLGMYLMDFLPLKVVDFIVVLLSKLLHGNVSKYGLRRPSIGPFKHKLITGRTPTIDVGAVGKIRKGQIQVYPPIKHIHGNEFEFVNGKVDHFDAVIFATGYKSTVNYWLKDGEKYFNNKGMPRTEFPHHWRVRNGLYCAGFAMRGLAGIAMDAKKIATDISLTLAASK
ncbi:hypothetical protein Tsubulata_035395 [Turnera subulata]|uniref:Flavin-containing monooxygenase n=1 Tax=Turnera subulata TaxID=218843 RepID=A0A9Q0F568_9ROSI|nr:hypothetical protein Tsubulata_035395 [Turnera subulata]